MSGGDILSFNAWVEHSKVVSTQHITERGAYKEDNIPEDYVGSVLTMKIVHTVIMVDHGGRLQKLEFAIDEAKDKDDNKTGGITLDGETVKAGANPTELTTEVNEDLPEGIKARADIMTLIADNNKRAFT